MYDYLIVGAGLYGAVFANEKRKQGKKCLVIDERDHIAGNAYTEDIFGIEVHKYGAHIFHTDSKVAWEYVNSYADFNRYTNSPIAVYKNEVYNLPFNMNTFHALWGVRTPDEARKRIENEIEEAAREIESKGGDRNNPANLEEQALLLGGRDIYEKLIKGYTEKQWGRRASELPAFIIKRLPFRFIYDNNYFNDRYQGIPIDGYTGMVERILSGIEVRLSTEYEKNKASLEDECDKGCETVYTGSIDRYFEYVKGNLEYRSLDFRTEVLSQDDYQGNAVVNYTEYEVPYTRIIEHKYFEEFGNNPRKSRENTTVITHEYPADWTLGKEPYYPINDERNDSLYNEYKEMARERSGLRFGGRLGKYKYYDMDDVILDAIKDASD